MQSLVSAGDRIADGDASSWGISVAFKRRVIRGLYSSTQPGNVKHYSFPMQDEPEGWL
jgi:hypothetical protein